MAEYNGWANRATWNVALWLGNDERYYRAAVSYGRHFPHHNTGLSAKDAKHFVTRVLGWDATPDGIGLSSVRWGEIADCIREMAAG